MPSNTTAACAVEAFLAGKNFRQGNYEVKENCLLVFNNTIVEKITECGSPEIRISTAGWETQTTFRVFNLLPNVRVHQKNKQLFLNNEPWDGDWVTVK